MAHSSSDLTEVAVGFPETRKDLSAVADAAAINSPADLPAGGLAGNVGASRKDSHSSSSSVHNPSRCMTSQREEWCANLLKLSTNPRLPKNL